MLQMKTAYAGVFVCTNFFKYCFYFDASLSDIIPNDHAGLRIGRMQPVC